MYGSSGGGGGDVNVPALPSRRSANSRQSPSMPQMQPLHQQYQQRFTTSTVRPQVPTSSSSSSTANLDHRVDSSASRKMNDYRDFPTTATVTTTTTTTTAATVQPGDSHSVSPRSSSENEQTSSLPLPRDHVELPESRRKNDDGRDDSRGKKKNKTPGSKSSECRESIICQRCGGCRCQECARHPATGRRTVEVCSCVSCVVAIRRHRQPYDSNNDDDDEDLCACSSCRPACCRRWALLVVLSICLPCLCFYWPLRCAAGACSRCSGRQRRGCHCVERSTSELRPTESIVIDRVTST